MSYQLSEAYENLYNPRVESFVDDNLRFIDFMDNEDIEEVVESVYWELRDYGNTLEEAVDTLSLATSTEVISEAYDEILLEFDMSPEDRAKLALKASQGKGLKFARRLADKQRRDARVAKIQHAVTKVRRRVDGPIARAKAAFKGAQGGMGTAKKALSQTAQDGKAKLGKLLRRGVSAVAQGVRSTGRAIGSAGKAMERRGAAATQSGLQSRRAGRAGAGGQMQLVFEPTAQEKAGGATSKLGRAIRKAGAAIARTSSKSPTAAKTSLPQAKTKSEPSQNIKIAALSAARPKGPAKPQFRPTGATGAAARIAASRQSRSPKPSGYQAFRSDVSRARTTAARSRVVEKAPKSDINLSQKSSTKRKPIPMSKSGKPLTGAAASAKIRATRRQLREDFNIIIEQLAQDLISEGYTDNFNSALNIIDNLSEDVFNELIADYLD